MQRKQQLMKESLQQNSPCGCSFASVDVSAFTVAVDETKKPTLEGMQLQYYISQTDTRAVQ